MTQQQQTGPTNGQYIRAINPGLEVVRAAGEDGMPTLRGHFAVFNQWTEIRSFFEGHFMERFLPGGFKKTFREQRSRMKVLFQHGRDPQVGDKPLGPIKELREDGTKGAYYEVPMLDTSYNRDLVPGLEEGLYGASFRFVPVKVSINEDPGRSAHNPDGIPEHSVQEARVSEFGPVTFPAYEGATAGVRSLTDEFMFEALSRDTGKLGELIDFFNRAVQDRPPASTDEAVSLLDLFGQQRQATTGTENSGTQEQERTESQDEGEDGSTSRDGAENGSHTDTGSRQQVDTDKLWGVDDRESPAIW